MLDVSLYRARLSKASPKEFVHRASESFRMLFLKNMRRGSRLVLPTLGVLEERLVRLELPQWRGEISEETIDWVLGGGVFTLNTDPNRIKEFEAKVQSTFFSNVGTWNHLADIRSAWETARLQHVTLLCAILRQGVEGEKAQAIREFVRSDIISWIGRNKFLHGPHHMSVMECGLRIPLLIAALKVAEFAEDERKLVYTTVYQHAWLTRRRLSLFSSLGNHTVCECVGLVFAGALFGKDGEDWLKRGLELLQEEAIHQIVDDGGPVEQSLDYHRFVIDLYWLVVDLAEKNGIDGFSDIKPRLERGEIFLAAFRDSSGDFPSIGDGDDGHAIAPGLVPRRPAIAKGEGVVTTFSESGYTVINGHDEVLVTFDHGPLGMPPLYNHGHADALSITLSKNGRKLLVDPGTYRYNGVGEWRRYFRGTRAHNTVTIDDQDQAVQETDFIWSHPYRSRLEANTAIAGGHYIKAQHDGYMRLKCPVRHERSILWLDRTSILIKDTFRGRGNHSFELNFHVHPESDIRRNGTWWGISNHDTTIFLRMVSGDEFTCRCGEEDPPIGWYSPAYGVKEKSGVLSCKKTGVPEDVTFTTLICTEDRIGDG